jgi:hypothetical protein
MTDTPGGAAAPAPIDCGSATPEACEMAGEPYPPTKTPEQAQAWIKGFRGGAAPELTKRYLAGDKFMRDYVNAHYRVAYPAGGVHDQLMAASDGMIGVQHLDEAIKAQSVPKAPELYEDPPTNGFVNVDGALIASLRATASRLQMPQYEYAEIYAEVCHTIRNRRDDQQFEHDRAAAERGLRGLWGAEHDRRHARVSALVRTLPDNLRRALEEGDLGNRAAVARLLDRAADRLKMPLE